MVRRTEPGPGENDFPPPLVQPSWLVLFRPARDEEPVAFDLEIRLGERVVETIRGEVQGMFESSEESTYSYSGQR